ncbi:Transcription initiation factor TFIID subunit 5 [Paecilomyces lecythidis]|uniref:Transcription initiation factor TFIID subunit 5 n=1 Tax=Paecilomyces lecythidis TaxID=3004212 RepID=A0ABR3Y9G7_9EURO
MTRKSGRASKSGSKARSRRKPKHTDRQVSPDAQGNEQPAPGVAAAENPGDAAVTEAPAVTSDETTTKADSRQQSASTLNDFEIYESAHNLEGLPEIAVASEENFPLALASPSREDGFRYRRLDQTRDSAQDEIRALTEQRQAREYLALAIQQDNSPAKTSEASASLTSPSGLAVTPGDDSSTPSKKESASGSQSASGVTQAAPPQLAPLQAASSQATLAPVHNSIASDVFGLENFPVPVERARKRTKRRRRPKSPVTYPTIRVDDEPLPEGYPPSCFQRPILPRPDDEEAFPTTTGEPAILSPQENSPVQGFASRLNDRVIDYLAKKGYSRTEAMLRMESANQEIDGRPLPPLGEDARPKYRAGFELLKSWVEDNLDLYKPELRRVMWPLFVYSFLNLVTSFYPQDAKQFFASNKNLFLPEHNEDIRALEPISLPEHVQDNSVAKIYRGNKYRLILSNPAFSNLMQFLENKQKEGGSVMSAILSSYCTIITKERTADDRFSFAAMLGKSAGAQTFPLEDEGIPGHHPGSAYTGDNPAMTGTLPRLKLGKLPPDSQLEEDVRGELADEDAKNPPAAGRNTLVQEYDQMIKKEEDEDAPTRAEIPYPPSTARDVAMEVQKVKENRDRFKIEGRTGGVGPAVSVCMFTFHNTYDGITCLDFSDDNMLVAAGMQESYIRVWSLDGQKIKPTHEGIDDKPLANSHRLIGHSGPIYAVAFAPSATPADGSLAPTNVRFLLSSSADKTIRLWSLDLWQCMVVYKGHDHPVWDLSWGPYGYYFVSGGHDKTARLWATDRIRQQRIFAGHDQDVDCVCFHPNSAYIFTGSCDRTVRMWAVTTGNAVRMFTGHTGNITALACSKNGKILASADDQGSIILWDLAPGRQLKRMRGHGKGGIWSLSWSAESTVLVSGGADGTVRVWDVAGPAQDPAATQGRVVGEGGAGTKIDAGNASAAGAQPSASVGPGANKKKGKDVVVTPDQISAFPTKKSPVYKVKFTNMNLIVAGGAYLP